MTAQIYKLWLINSFLGNLKYYYRYTYNFEKRDGKLISSELMPHINGSLPGEELSPCVPLITALETFWEICPISS